MASGWKKPIIIHPDKSAAARNSAEALRYMFGSISSPAVFICFKRCNTPTLYSGDFTLSKSTMTILCLRVFGLLTMELQVVLAFVAPCFYVRGVTCPISNIVLEIDNQVWCITLGGWYFFVFYTLSNDPIGDWIDTLNILLLLSMNESCWLVFEIILISYLFPQLFQQG